MHDREIASCTKPGIIINTVAFVSDGPSPISIISHPPHENKRMDYTARYARSTYGHGEVIVSGKRDHRYISPNVDKYRVAHDSEETFRTPPVLQQNISGSNWCNPSSAYTTINSILLLLSYISLYGAININSIAEESNRELSDSICRRCATIGHSRLGPVATAVAVYVRTYVLPPPWYSFTPGVQGYTTTRFTLNLFAVSG